MSAPATKTEELDALLGTTLAERYRMDELLGIGGMGAVFRARHLLLKRDVAVKVLHASLAANEDISKRFDREAQSAARLDHPNIIPVTEFGSTDEGMKYMVMQLLSGKELGDLMTGPLDPLRAIDLEIQILRGLEHAHDNGVVHRDLKPENVFVTTDHEDEEILKLVDFGIAKIVDEDDEDASQPLTRMGLVFGTPHYMSPEQATGSAIDHRTDIYSAGVMLYQMLAGQLPFDHEDPVSLIRMQVTVEPPPLPDSVPLPVQRVVKMMMAKERDKRYPDARSARKALQAVQVRLAEAAGVPVKFDPQDTGLVDPRDIYPPDHEALANNPAFARSDTGRQWDPSEISGPELGGPAAPGSPHPTPLPDAPSPASASSSGQAASETPAPKVTQMSLADALTSAHPAVQQRSPFAEALARVPRTWWYVIGGAVGLLVVLAAWPSGDKDEDEGDSEGVVAKPTGDEGEPEPVISGVGEETLVAIDKALTSKNEDEALDLIRPARDKHPDDPQLLWREGKALSLKRAKSHDVTALERYGEALDHDPSLVEDPDFYGELYVLLNQKNLREQAIDLSLQKLGPAGHKFLLGLVNVDDPKQMLDWTDRHRILDALRTDPAAMKLVDWKLNTARDLYQVEQTDQPCVEFAKVLDRISESGDAYYMEHLFGSKLSPPGFKDKSDDDPSICEALPGKLVVIRDLLAVAHPDEAEKYKSNKKKKQKKKKR